MKKFLPLFLFFPFCVRAQNQLTTYNVGTSFACIAVDSNYNIWAGRSNGAYLLNKSANPTANQFQSVAGTTTYNVQALLADRNQNVWVGHNGLGGSTAESGGIERIPINGGTTKHFSPDANAECLSFFARDGLGTLNCANLALDFNNTIWSAHKYHDLNLTFSPFYILTPGSISYKPANSAIFFSKGTYKDYHDGTEPPELPYPLYTCNVPISQSPQSRNVYSVACGSGQVWISVAPYISHTGQSFPARILKYNLNGTYDTSFNYTSIGIPAGGFFNGLYVTPQGDLWVTMSLGKGFAVRHNNVWTYVNTSNACIFPSSGTLISNNAIWGNKLGQVFIGTNEGLIVYRGTGPVNEKSSYTLYSIANFNFVSNQILGGISEKDSIQWIATNNGIMRTTLGSNYPLTNSSFDYNMCSDPAVALGIYLIESKITNPSVFGQADYHSYLVETEVCTNTGLNGKNCNAEYVYKMMKNDVTLTALTPWDFPYDHLSPLLLFAANKADITNIVYQKVKDWNPATMPHNENGGILFIEQVLSPPYVALNNSHPANMAQPFINTGLAEQGVRIFLNNIQKASNPADVQPCASYTLYNPGNYISDRVGYQALDFAFCNNQLGSVFYDKVWIVPDNKNLTITNYTQPGHILYPGKVVRTIVEECGKVKIVTLGVGLNYCGNNFAGKMNAIGNIITGSIVFKNIDLRLKKAFEAAH